MRPAIALNRFGEAADLGERSRLAAHGETDVPCWSITSFVVSNCLRVRLPLVVKPPLDARQHRLVHLHVPRVDLGTELVVALLRLAK